MNRLSSRPATCRRSAATARRAIPEECCGFLIGRSDGETTVVERVLSVGNERQDSRHNRYLISPETVLAAHKEARAAGRSTSWATTIRIPDHPSRPSEFDREHAWPGLSYLIVSVQGGRVADARSWRLADDRERFEEETVDPAAGRPLAGSPEGGGLMSVTIQIPTPLRRFTGEQGEVQVEGAHGRRGAAGSHPAHPALQRHLYHRRRRPAQLRQPLPQRRGRAPPPARRHPGRRRRHAVDHPVDRRGRRGHCRYRARRGAAGAVAGRDPPLQPAPDHARGRHGRAAQAQGGARC